MRCLLAIALMSLMFAGCDNARRPNGGRSAPMMHVKSASPDAALNDRATVVTLHGILLGDVTDAVLHAPGSTPLTIVSVSDDQLGVLIPPGLKHGDWTLTLGSPSGSTATTFRIANLIDPDAVGAFAVGYRNVFIAGAHGDNPPARVYYPATYADLSTPVDTRAAPFPCVVYNHGFKPPILDAGIEYRNNTFIVNWLASHGYVVICPDQSPNNDLFGTAQDNCRRDAEDARAALEHLAIMNTGPDPLADLLDLSRVAVGGHSRGGCASVMAAADEAAALGPASRVRAAFLFGAPSRDSQARGNPQLAFGDFTATPLLAIGAEKDTVAAFTAQSEIYALAGTGSMILELIGGNHSQYKDSATLLLGDTAATIALETQHAICRRYVTAWLGRHLRGVDWFDAMLYAGNGVATDARIRNLDWK